MVTSETPSRERERIISMPSTPAIRSSTSWVMRDSTTLAAAPGYATSTETIGGSMAGYSRTGSEKKAMAPASTMMRLTTAANTGRLTETSERITGTSLRPPRRRRGPRWWISRAIPETRA